jgi:hypothetical protein
VSDLGRLTNRFFLKDRCALPDQMSFSLARSWRAFVLAKEDRRGANKNEITIFVFSITAKDFSHGVLLDGKDSPLLQWLLHPTVEHHAFEREGPPR